LSFALAVAAAEVRRQASRQIVPLALDMKKGAGFPRPSISDQ